MPMSSAAAVAYSMHPITTTSELAAACKRMAAHPFVTIDTEFLRETTYYPLLCVAQMASPDEAVVVDALAPGIDLAPFYALMADEKVMKVFHAARQDIEIIWHGAKLIPHPIFDTQVAAMVLGYGDSISYDQLVQRITGDALDKSHRFTDWTRRPLSEAQLTYAISDVTHLREVYHALVEDLGRRGRADWVEDEMQVLTSPETYRMDPQSAWQRLKTRVRKPKELAVLIEVAAWREREAQSRDVPRSRVLKDDVIARYRRAGADQHREAQESALPAQGVRALALGRGDRRRGRARVGARSEDIAASRAHAAGGQCLRRDRTPQGAATHDLGASPRRRQGDRHGRRSRAHRVRRRGGCSGAERLAARAVRRESAGAQARPARARHRKGPRRHGRTRQLKGQSVSEQARWQDRYSTPDYLFGKAPNYFLASCKALLPKSGKVLAVADGEARNGVWLAEQGLDVTSIDFSEAAQAKAATLAKERGVAITLLHADVHAWTYPPDAFDVVVEIFTQFSTPAERPRKWAGMRKALKPGGLLILQGYTPKQLEYGTGGPNEIERLYTRAMLEQAFGDFRDLKFVEEELEMHEGTAHGGMSAVIGLTGRKP